MESFVANGTSIDVLEVVRIAEAAGDVILEIYGKDESEWGFEIKGKDEPLTKADKGANEVICAGLKQMAPEIPIVSEECTQIPYEERKAFDYFWCVDPLDGTREFLKRNGQFTVNIALCRGPTPVMGVVTVPVQGTAYYSVERQGAYKKDSRTGPFYKIHAAKFDCNDEGLTIVGSRSHSSPASEAFLKNFKSPKFVLLGSSLKLLMVADGSAHVYPRLAPTNEWDTCAAHAIVNESGGCVLQMEGGQQPAEPGKALVYNKENLLNPFFVVYGNRVE